MLRSWKCTNPKCEMNIKGLIQINDQPAYAQVRCEKCGALMVGAETNTSVLFVGDYPDTLLTSGALPITKTKKGFLSSLAGDKEAASISDPDITSYPRLDEVLINPLLLRPDMYSYLQTADIFLAQREGKGCTVVVARCPSHHLSRPLSSNPPVGIHVEAHLIDKWYIFGIYTLVWDNATSPWFAEMTVCPYDIHGANEREMGSPLAHGYFWRKLFYLLTQEKTEIVFLNENHQVVSQRTAILRAGQPAQFSKQLELLESCSGKPINKPDLLQAHTQYSHFVDIKGVQSRLPRL